MKFTTGGLSRQILIAMLSLALGASLLVFLGGYVFYAIYSAFSPGTFPDHEVTTDSEWVAMVMTVLVGLIAAFIVAIRLSRRILSPINSVAEGLRSLAEGDLSARAIADD